MSLRLRLLYKAATIYWRLFKPVTLGVKALLIKNDSVLLVKHSYRAGWFLPGGGVKKQEDLETAVRRECREEIGGQIGALQLFGVYSNVNEMKNDHVVVMLSHEFSYQGPNDKEIIDIQFFPMHQLPVDVSAGTRNRIEELLSQTAKPYLAAW